MMIMTFPTANVVWHHCNNWTNVWFTQASENTEKAFTETSEMAVSFMIVSTDNGLLHLKWYFKDSDALELTVAVKKNKKLQLWLFCWF